MGPTTVKSLYRFHVLQRLATVAHIRKSLSALSLWKSKGCFVKAAAGMGSRDLGGGSQGPYPHLVGTSIHIKMEI